MQPKDAPTAAAAVATAGGTADAGPSEQPALEGVEPLERRMAPKAWEKKRTQKRKEIAAAGSEAAKQARQLKEAAAARGERRGLEEPCPSAALEQPAVAPTPPAALEIGRAHV